ncbi:hypothetical protein LIER_10167 [Lithospermum erythrorhizon]|uniref:DC1 domain-containing protein n=1 Tax=Lithospermum erythrorhizon TaxID=34254 RepID=A0AAV3PIG5_LITER
MEQLKHFSHSHPLNLMKADGINNLKKVIYCNACQLPISEGLAYYGCKNCAYFLHKHCTEIPTELANPMHPQHKLLLRANRPCVCDVCRTHWTGFTYVCKPCDFDIDINCSLLDRTDKYNAIGHDHQLEFHPRSTVFFCDACGETGEDASYQCLTCHFWRITKKTAARAPQAPALSNSRKIPFQTNLFLPFQTNRLPRL